jgi:dienelactone hydrolase
MSEQVDARLKSERFTHPVQLLEYPDAGHAVFGQPLKPDDPHLADLAKNGGSIEGNQTARRDSWTRAIVFIDAALKR